MSRVENLLFCQETSVRSESGVPLGVVGPSVSMGQPYVAGYGERYLFSNRYSHHGRAACLRPLEAQGCLGHQIYQIH